MMKFDKTDIVYRKLDEQDAIKLFDCGDDDLNDFIINDAPLYYKSRIPFYYGLGFVPLSKQDEKSDTRLLYFDLKQI